MTSRISTARIINLTSNADMNRKENAQESMDLMNKVKSEESLSLTKFLLKSPAN